MSERCICDTTAEAGPSTHRAPKHLSKCLHSDLRMTTKKFRRMRIRAIPGTRKLVAIPELVLDVRAMQSQ